MAQRTPGPFDYYEDIHGGVNGDTIRADAEDPALNASTIAALASELEGDSKKVAGQLSGDITATVQQNPQDVSKQAQGLAAKGFFAVGLINDFAKDVDSFDTTVDTLNSNYATQVRALEQSPKYDDSAGMTRNIQGAVKRALNGQYSAAINKLDTDADSIATRFKSPPSKLNDYVKQLMRDGLIPLSAAVLYPGLTLTIGDKQQYYKNFLKTMTPEQQKQWIAANNSTLPPEAGKYVDPTVQQYFAHLVAEKIKAPGTIDRDTANLMMFLSTGPAFSQKLYQEVSPREMASEIEDFNNDVFPKGTHPTIDTDKMAIYKDFINAAGVSLATYSNQHGQYAPPAGPNGQTGQQKLALDWYNAITDGDHKQDASALTLLVRSGGHYAGYDSTFMGNLTGNIYKWERDQDGAVWGPRDGDGMWDPNDPPHLEAHSAGKGGTYEVYEGGTKGTDGLANLLGGMEHSPQASKNFFMGHYDTLDGTPPDTMQHKMDYLIGGGDGRTWDASDNSDEGEGLGRALEAASVGGGHDADGAAIASAAFHNVARFSGGGDTKFLPDGVWHVNPQLAPHLGNIAAGYASDVYNTYSHGEQQYGSGQLQIDPSDLDTVVGEIGRGSDKSGVENLTAALAIEGNQQVHDKLDPFIEDWKAHHNGETPSLAQLEKSRPDIVETLHGRVGTTGDVLGRVLKNAITVDTSDEGIAATRAAYASKAIDIASGFLPGAGDILGEGASHVAKSSLDLATGEGIDQLKDAVSSQDPAANTGSVYLQGQRGSTEDVFDSSLVNQFHSEGMLKDAPPELFDPKTGNVRSGIFDSDKLENFDTTGLSPEQVEKFKTTDWPKFRDSDAYNQILALGESGKDAVDRALNN